MPRAAATLRTAHAQIWLVGFTLAGLGCLWAGAAGAADEEPETVDYQKLAKMSLEELMATEVTSVAGVGQEWFKTPAAMYAISNDEVKQSGHRSIAEALRLVPGMTVIHTDSNTWWIGARGFNREQANKLLVLIDGRETYDYLFSGTFWDVQDVLLEDLDRIEVIRGPGATLWGANAVNGVINVTTRSAKDTQGLYAAGGVGIGERGFTEARYGFQLGDDSWMRVWGKWFDRDAFEVAGPRDASDQWDMGRGGMRYDREGDNHTFLSFQAEAYGSNRIGETLGTPPEGFNDRVEGEHALVKLGQEEPGADGWAVQAYYDRTTRVTASRFQVERNTADLDFRHHFKWWEDTQELVWGLGYRYTADSVDSGSFTLPSLPPGSFTFDPDHKALNTFSAFVQDTWTLMPHELFVMAGSKFEHNDYTHFEVQPSGRIWWTPDDNQTLWAAISRPVRTPSRIEQDFLITIPGVGVFQDDHDTSAERLTAYELGYRRRITKDFTADLALFFNDYDNLIITRDVPPPPGLFIAQKHSNGGRAQSYGGELAGTWRIAPNWTLRSSYSVIEVNELSPSDDKPENATPQQQAQLRSTYDITKGLQLDAALYYVDNIPAFNVDHYLRLDVGVNWKITKNFELAVWGQNLLDPSHRESSQPPEVQRGGYLMGIVRF